MSREPLRVGSLNARSVFKELDSSNISGIRRARLESSVQRLSQPVLTQVLHWQRLVPFAVDHCLRPGGDLQWHSVLSSHICVSSPGFIILRNTLFARSNTAWRSWLPNSSS